MINVKITKNAVDAVLNKKKILSTSYSGKTEDIGTAKHVICGHEHMNDFSVLYKGIRLTYTLKIGFGSGFQKGFNGGTVITVGENGIKRITHKSRIGPRLKNILSLDTK